MNELKSKLMNHLENYLNDKLSGDELESWLVCNLQDILDSGDINLIRISDDIDADFIELGEELIDDTTFRKNMQGYFSELNTLRLSVNI